MNDKTFETAPTFFLIQGYESITLVTGKNSISDFFSLACYASTSATVRSVTSTWDNSHKKISYYATDGAKYQCNIKNFTYTIFSFFND